MNPEAHGAVGVVAVPTKPAVMLLAPGVDWLVGATHGVMHDHRNGAGQRAVTPLFALVNGSPGVCPHDCDTKPANEGHLRCFHMSVTQSLLARVTYGMCPHECDTKPVNEGHLRCVSS